MGIVANLLIENEELKKTVRRLEILIADAIPSLSNSMNNLNLSDGQRRMARDAYEAIFRERDEWHS